MQQVYHIQGQVAEDGTLTLNGLPAGEEVKVIVMTDARNGFSEAASPMPSEGAGGTLDFMYDLIGTVEAPEDWASEHDHYLYGSPKRDQASDE